MNMGKKVIKIDEKKPKVLVLMLEGGNRRRVLQHGYFLYKKIFGKKP